MHQDTLYREKIEECFMEGDEIGLLFGFEFIQIQDPFEKRAFLMAQLVKNLPAVQETQVLFPGWGRDYL